MKYIYVCSTDTVSLRAYSSYRLLFGLVIRRCSLITWGKMERFLQSSKVNSSMYLNDIHLTMYSILKYVRSADCLQRLFCSSVVGTRFAYCISC